MWMWNQSWCFWFVRCILHWVSPKTRRKWGRQKRICLKSGVNLYHTDSYDRKGTTIKWNIHNSNLLQRQKHIENFFMCLEYGTAKSYKRITNNMTSNTYSMFPSIFMLRQIQMNVCRNIFFGGSCACACACECVFFAFFTFHQSAT